MSEQISYELKDLDRIVNCPGYKILRTFAQHNNENETSPVKLESDAAQSLFNCVLNKEFESAYELVDRKTSNGYYVTSEMADYIEPSIEYINKRNVSLTLVSEKMHFTLPNTEIAIRGICEVVQYDEINKILYVDNLKYGWKVFDKISNWSMIAIALGLIIRKGFNPTSIIFTIHQPRPWHQSGKIRQEIISIENLYVLRGQMISSLMDESPNVITGEQCYHCEICGVCPSARRAALASVEISQTPHIEELPNNEISIELSLLENAQNAIKYRIDALSDLAKSKISKGEQIQGYDVDFSYGHRKWNDGVDADLMLMLTGIDLSKKDIISPSQAKKKGVTEEIINSMSDRPKTGYKLVKSDINAKANKLLNPEK